MKSIRVCGLTLGLMGCVSMLQGCLPPSAPLPARVEVRDASSGRPIPHALVRWTGGNVFIPPRDVLGPPISPPATPPGGRCETDASGTAKVVLAGNRPNELTVSVAGYAPLSLTLETGKSAVSGALDWSQGRMPPVDAASAVEPRLEVRVRVDQ